MGSRHGRLQKKVRRRAPRLRRRLRLVVLLALALLLGCRAAPEAAPEAAQTAPTTTVVPPPATPIPSLPPPPIEIDGTALAPTVVLPPSDAFFQSPEYGMHISQWWHVDDILPRDLQLVREMGFGWVKQNFSWRDIEFPEKGQYDWYRPDRIVEEAEAAGLKLLVRIDRHPLWSVQPYLPDDQITANQPPARLEDLGDFCYTLADRFAGRIHAYQVWNEPNLSREWGERPPDPVEYTALLKICYENIKAADPAAIVISAGLAPTGTQPPVAMPDTDYLQGMYAAGAGTYFDVLGINAPGYKAPPALAPEEGLLPEWGGHRWNVFRHVEEMRAIMVANGDAAKQIAILEMGWILQQDFHADYTWFGVTEEQQAAYLVGAFEYARENWQPWIGLMTALYMADFAWQPEQHEQYWWSIVLPDGTPRMAYYALRDMPK